MVRRRGSSLASWTALLLAMLCAASTVQAAPPLVVLVRLAERADEAGPDPGLSPAGEARAEALAAALADAGIGAIFTSQFRRTQLTAAPLAQRLGLQPQVIEAHRGASAEHIAATVAAIEKQDSAVLVVGHSNTVAALLRALGGPALADLCEHSFSHALVLQRDSQPPRLLRLRYGTDSPPAAADCL